MTDGDRRRREREFALAEQNAEVPTRTTHSAAARALTHYRDVAPVLLTHLRDRRVIGSGAITDAPDGGAHFADLHIADLADLAEAVRSGILWFTLPGLIGPDLISLRIRPGADSGIDIVATAALALAEQFARDGRAASAFTDGEGGLYLIGFGVGPTDPRGGALGYATDLSSAAPELATMDADDAEGRALVVALPAVAAPGVPAPYSLVPVDGDLGVIAPLTLDEVAAASAGMLLDLHPSDLPERIAAYGDLAAGLAEATVPPA